MWVLSSIPTIRKFRSDARRKIGPTRVLGTPLEAVHFDLSAGAKCIVPFSQTNSLPYFSSEDFRFHLT